METRIQPGAVAGFGCLIRVKMTRSAGDPAASGLIFVQIFIFRDNPLKYTDPDGRITGWHIAGALLIVGGVAVAIGGSLLSDGTLTGPSLKAGGDMIASGSAMIGIGETIENAQKSTGKSLTDRAQAATPSPAPQQPNQNDDDPNFKDDKETAKDFGHNNTSDFERTTKQDIIKDARSEARTTGNKNLQRFLGQNDNPNIGTDRNGNIWLQSRTTGEQINTGLPKSGYIEP
jgi:hypothetical protein